MTGISDYSAALPPPGSFFIVCGAGRTGSTIATMLADESIRVVVVDNSPEPLDRLREHSMITVIEGDSMEDEVLHESGVETARGLFATLPQDRDNVFLVLSAKRLNPDLRVVSRSVDPDTTRKLRLVGADRSVTQSEVEGLRLSSQLVRPDVVRFLDGLLHARGASVEYRRIGIPEGSASAGASIGELQLGRRTGIVIVALRRSSGRMIYSPRARLRVETGDSLIAFASEADAKALESALAEGPPGTPGRHWLRSLLRPGAGRGGRI